MEMMNLAPRPTIYDQFVPKDPLDFAAYNPAEVMVGSLKEEGNVFVMPAMMGGESSEKPVWDEATFLGTVSMLLETTDEVVLDMASLIYGPAKTVRTQCT